MNEIPRGIRRPAGRAAARPAYRLGAFLVGVLLLLGVLVGRLAQMQVVEGAQYRAAAHSASTRTLTTPATRGRILDRNGVPLVDNAVSLSVTADRAVLDRQRDGGRGVIERLAAFLGRDASAMWDRSHLCGEEGAPPPPRCWSGSPQLPIPIASRVDPQLALALTEMPQRWPGLAVLAEPQRHYPAPDGAVAAQVVGHLGQATAEDIAAGRASGGQWLGKAGLEQEYDEALRGTDGATVVEVGPDGRARGVVSTTAPTPGHDVVTSLDARVQGAAEKALAAAVASARAAHQRADAAAAVVLDLRDGGVVASASYPTYDPTVWVGGISATDLQRISPAITDQVTGHVAPPASTFKALSVQAAMDNGASPTAKYGCPSQVTVAGRTFRNYESAAYGDIDLTTALTVSCDTIFYSFAVDRWKQLAGNVDDTSRANAQRGDSADQFVQTARRFGLGADTGIDLPTESTGRVPGRVWKLDRWQATKDVTCRRARNGYPEEKDAKRAAYLQAIAVEQCQAGFVYRPGDAINLSVGQGDTLVTPLQLARAYGAIATGGTLWTPHVVTRVVDASGRTVSTVAPPRTSVALAAGRKDFLDRALASVVTSGTARGAFAGFPLAGYPVAGKTGTGEVFGKGDTAWFASYGPVGAPRYVVVVMVAQGGTGGSVAAPAARRVWDVLRTLP